MSYIVYINGEQIILSNDRPIAQTKQANDLARLDNRQSNFTNRIIAPYNAVNDKIMGNLSMVGNLSNIPYQKNRVDIIDAGTGKHLIYNGWANVNKTNSKGYEINCYDGIIDFYRRIENKNISEIGVNELNHLKKVSTVIETFTDDDLAYKYIVADYNGKAIADGKINIDYLVPSARKSYIWRKIHQFAEFTFSGEVFSSEKFLNNFITFPKPVPTTEPALINITNQLSNITADGGFFSAYIFLDFLPNNFSNGYANNNGELNRIYITTTGAYKLNMNGSAPTVTYEVFNSALVSQSSGSINPQINQSIYLILQAGDVLLLFHFIPLLINAEDVVTTEFSFVDGYYANFEEVLMDFQAKDFVNEIMIEFGLTAYKDKYKNHIVYKTLDELLQDEDIVDWSKNFKRKNGDSYSIGNYAKKNLFKYRYNDENSRYNDGFISINNENLSDELTAISSKYYTPNRAIGGSVFYAGLVSNVYKLWEKELKDDGTIEYKDLAGRFYSLRHKKVLGSFVFASEALGIGETVTSIPFESYFRMSWQQIIIDNYKSIESIFDKAKAREVLFDLSFQEFESFNLDKLIYVDKLSSYYLVNKIKSFVKGQLTPVELIEVDYKKELEIKEPIDRFIIITDITQDLCELTFDVETNIEQPADVLIIPYALTPDGIAGVYYAPYGEPIPAILLGNKVVHTFTEIPEMFFGGYRFKIIYNENLFQVAESNLFDTIINISGSCYIVPPTAPPTLSYITITNVETLSVVSSGRLRNVRVYYISNLTAGNMNLLLSATNITFGSYITYFNNILASQNGYIDCQLANNALSGGAAFYNLQLSSMGITSNIANS